MKQPKNKRNISAARRSKAGPRPATPERIQKVLAAAGLASRRQAEGWIKAGRLLVNGKPAELGQRISNVDKLSLDGRPLSLPRQLQQHRVIIYNKPEGEVVTRHDPEGRPTVFEALPRLRHGRWVAVGRLDTNTSGLLLFTTDGALAHRLMHPSGEVAREYAVRVLGEVPATILEKLRVGVELEDGMAHFESVRGAGGQGANHWYHVSLREGRNREVRRLWESQHVAVSRLIRIRYGPVVLPRDLPRGAVRELSETELAVLLKAVGMSAENAR